MPPSSPPSDFEIWSRYEDVAMHFNGLLIQFRAQIAGALALLVTLGSYIAEGKITDARSRYTSVSAASSALLVALLAAGSMDVFYYSRMLETTVDAIVQIEARMPVLQLSTSLKQDVGLVGRYVAAGFYLVTLLALVCVAIWAACRTRREPRD